MSNKTFLDGITSDIDDIISKSFQYISTKSVPSRHDGNMTFDRGENKIGKLINTCVLYVDIRDSVSLNGKHSTQTMGRIYSIFTKSVLKAAKHHSGEVRNIIGDRVMIVFPEDNCFVNAVNCAVTINQISSIIAKKFTAVAFKCGIGVDYGEMRVIKVGMHRQGTIAIDNKNLVWVGKPANFASRLTDVANKKITKTLFRVKYNPYNFLSFMPGPGIYSLYQMEDVLTSDEFAKKINYDTTLGITYSGGKFIIFTKEEKVIDFKPIILSEKVFVEYKKLQSANAANWELVKEHNIKDITYNIYQSNLIWRI